MACILRGPIAEFFLIVLSGLLLIVGITTNAMIGFPAPWPLGRIRIGLFPSGIVKAILNPLPSWWRMSQTFAIVSVSALAAAVVATLLRRCPCSCLKSRTARILQALALCGTAACGLSCIITFGAGYPGVIKKLSPGLAALAVLLALDYSFALICLGALVALIAGVICVVDLVRGQ